MMKRLSTLLVSIATITAAAIDLAPAAHAFSITPTTNPETLRTALLGDTTGLSNFEIDLIGDARAFGVLQADPFGLNTSVALSTGKVADLAGVNTLGTDLSTDFGVTGAPGDSISLRLSFDNSTAENLFFQYVFGSEEFLEYGGSTFNDSFRLDLNGTNYARLSNGAAVTINNLVPTPGGAYHPDFINNPVGTGVASGVTRLDGFTKPLLFEAPLQPNARNTLIVNVRDRADGIFDSAVFIKGGTLGTVRPDGDNPGGGNPGGGDPGDGNPGGGDPGGKPGDGNPGDGHQAVPEPSTMLGLLTFSALTAHWRLKRRA